MKKVVKALTAVFATGLVAYAAMTYKVEVKVSEQAAAACDPGNRGCGG